MEKTPTVSVIMAVYNGERYLAEAIESILSQSFSDLEFIIVNDASTDASAEIVRNFVQRDGRITLLNNERNLERAESRNRGLKIARGKYVSVIDADDISLPEKLARQVKFLDENEEVACVGTSWYCIDEAGEIRELKRAPSSSASGAVHFLCNPSILARKACVEAAGGYRPALVPSEDYDLWLRVSELGAIANLPEPLFKYRVHQASSTSLQNDAMMIIAALALEMVEERRRGGRDMLSSLPPEEGMRLMQQRQQVRGAARRRKLSRSYATWGAAALALGQDAQAFNYAREALKLYPMDILPWKILTKSALSLAATRTGVVKECRDGERSSDWQPGR